MLYFVLLWSTERTASGSVEPLMLKMMTCLTQRSLVTPYLAIMEKEKVMLVVCTNWDCGSRLSGRRSHCKLTCQDDELS